MSGANPLPSHELATFVAAVESGTVHGAAEALDLTQSAATKRIISLERRLGVRLLNRSRRGVTPTEIGRLLYPESKHALNALGNAERVVLDRTDGGPLLKLAASQTVGEFLVPHWLAGFRSHHPGVRVKLDVTNSPAVLRELAAERVEIGFVEGTDALDELDVVTIVEDEIVVVVRAGHRWARQSAIPPEELVDEPFLAREMGSGTRSVAEGVLREHGVTLYPAVEVASTQGLKRAVESGGFTLMSRIAVAVECAAGTLVAKPLDRIELRRDLKAVRVRDRPSTQIAEGFWRYLASDVRLRPPPVATPPA